MAMSLNSSSSLFKFCSFIKESAISAPALNKLKIYLSNSDISFPLIPWDDAIYCNYATTL
jgi:hypothetical protein